MAQALERAGFDAILATDLEHAVEIARTRKLGGVVVGLNLKQGPSGDILGSGLSLFASLLAKLDDGAFASRPIVVTVTYRSSSMVVDTEAARYGIKNPRLIASKEDVLDPGFASAIRNHFAQGR